MSGRTDPLPLTTRDWSFRDRLRDIDMFFQGTDRVHETLRRVVAKLEEANISYAILGGIAVNAHRYQRTTGDVDFLLTVEGFRAFVRRCVPQHFDRVPGHSRRFLDRATGITFDILVTGLFPGSGRPGPIAFPDPAQVSEVIDQRRVVNLPTLIELKLAARRHRDFGDVVELIRANQLDEAFREKLHPSVQADYLECLEEKRREDEYEARQDQAMAELGGTYDAASPPVAGPAEAAPS